MNWNPPETAPRDRIIIIDCGIFSRIAVWNEYEQKWAYAELEYNQCDGKEDPYWITDLEAQILGWMPLGACR